MHDLLDLFPCLGSHAADAGAGNSDQFPLRSSDVADATLSSLLSTT